MEGKTQSQIEYDRSLADCQRRLNPEVSAYLPFEGESHQEVRVREDRVRDLLKERINMETGVKNTKLVDAFQMSRGANK